MFFSKSVEARHKTFGPKELASLLTILSEVRLVHVDLFTSAAQAIAPRVRELRPAELMRCTRALSRCGVKNEAKPRRSARSAKPVHEVHSVPRLAKPTFAQVHRVLRSLSKEPPSVYRHLTNQKSSSLNFQFYSFKVYFFGRFNKNPAQLKI